MESIPLLNSYSPDQTIAWHDGSAVACRSFLSHVKSLALALPEKPYAINLCDDRYWFLVGFAAALSRGQTTLLPQSRAPLAIEHLHEQYPSCFCLSDFSNLLDFTPSYSVPQLIQESMGSINIPLILGDHIGLIAFTSGTTGEPRPCFKSWHSLVSVAKKTAKNLGFKKREELSILATVPSQHMYGLETSIMLPIQHGWTLHAGRPFFPEDIRAALASLSPPRILITTPLHLRACVADGTQLPQLDCIVSATSPLPYSLAYEAEKLFNSQVLEIYGFAEAGTLATRRPTMDDTWQLLEGVQIEKQGNRFLVSSAHLPNTIHFPDEITPKGPTEFFLHGRASEFIKIGGHRASLSELNNHLLQIEGVEDGVFFMPDPNTRPQVIRPIAFAVSKHKNASDILADLRRRIDPIFLPRPLYVVSELPRNAAGKLPREHLLKLVKNQARESFIEEVKPTD